MNSCTFVNASYSDSQFNNDFNVTYDSVTVQPVYNISDDIKEGAIKNTTPSATLLNSNGEQIQNVAENNNEYKFSLSFNKPGDYLYKVKQQFENSNNIINNGDYSAILDRDEKEFIVHVTSNGGTLHTNIEYKNSDSMFDNVYIKSLQILNVPLEIAINTNFKKENLSIPETQAILSEIDEEGDLTEIETVSNTNNMYKFSDLSFAQPGSYMYEVRQVNSGSIKVDKYEYNISDERKIIEITITKNENTGQLSYDISGIEPDFDNDVDIKYAPITIPLSVNIVDNNEASIQVPRKTIIFSDEERVLDIIKTDSNLVTTNKISVNDIGTYTYKILQKRPHSYIKDGVQYTIDDNIITATVVVNVDNNNNLQYSINYSIETPTFNNQYKLTNQDDVTYMNIPVSIDIYSNSEEAKTLETEATLYRDGIPVETVVNTEGKYIFKNIDLTESGIYRYSIKQMNFDSETWSIDNEEIQFEIDTNHAEEDSDENVDVSQLGNKKFSPKIKLLTDDESNAEDNDNEFEYSINFLTEKTSFTNTDDSAQESEDDEETSTNVEVPNTGLFNSIFVIFGMLLISVGISILIYKRDDIISLKR